jgi:hypothetical protein
MDPIMRTANRNVVAVLLDVDRCMSPQGASDSNATGAMKQ